MSERAKYMVTMPPGTPIRKRGFVRPGQIFLAPSDDYVPSKTFKAVNQPAADMLQKLKTELQTKAKETREQLSSAIDPFERRAFLASAVAFERDAKAIDLKIVQITPQPKKVEQGMTMKDLDDLQKGKQKSQRAADK